MATPVPEFPGNRWSMRDLRVELLAASDWLAGIGVRVEGSRLLGQLAMAKRMVEAYERHGPSAWDVTFANANERNTALELMAEAIETGAIYRGLQPHPNAIPRHILQGWISGSVGLAQETSAGPMLRGETQRSSCRCLS
jgi:hypothetical protein